MEKRDYYRLREVILGLRGVYQENERELLKLKDYVSYDTDKVADLNFSLLQTFKETDPQLVCYFEEKRNKLQKMMDTLLKATGFYIYGGDIAHYYFESENGKKEIVAPNKKCSAHLADSFTDKALQILTSDFATNILSPSFFTKDSELECIVRPSEIHCFSDEVSIDYVPFSDMLQVFNMDSHKSITMKDVNRYLELPIEADKIPAYHKEKIEDSQAMEKGIVFSDDILNKRMTHFEIVDEREAFVFQKK